MLYNAKNGTLNIGNTTMDYIRFGSGQRTLVMLPTFPKLGVDNSPQM